MKVRLEEVSCGTRELREGLGVVVNAVLDEPQGSAEQVERALLGGCLAG